MLVVRIKVSLSDRMKFEVTNLFFLTFLTTFLNFVCCNMPESLEKSTRHHHLHQRHLANWNQENFLLIDYLNDGEMERRISYHGMTGKETSLGNNSKSLNLWQLSDGKAFIQMIFSSEKQIIDCDYIRKKPMVRGFLDKFYAEVDTARARNFTSPFTLSKRGVSEHEFRDFIENDLIDDDEMNELDGYTSSIYPGDVFGLRNLSYLSLRSDSDIPDDLRPLLNYHHLKKQCDERHRQMKDMLHNLNSDDKEKKKVAEEHLKRHKRAISEMFLMPNTKWCGKGHSADEYRELGGASRSDKCCRKHDHCKMIIKSMTTKFDTFNYRPYTISHCDCDLRFRTCLKLAGSSDANMVGKIFFNIIQTKCFIIKPEKICTKRSFWGVCEKYKIKKRAHLRDNRSF